jgi:hypothetical protein
LRDVIHWAPPIGPVRPTDVRVGIATLGLSTPVEGVDAHRWSMLLRPWELHEAVYVLAVLDAVVPSELRTTAARGLDVGCKSWSYLAAQRQIVPGPWCGVELDAYRRVGGLQTRASIARWRLRSSPGCRFIAGPVQSVTESFDVVTWFLPFMTVDAHRRWGLSDRSFDPTGVAAHVWSLVAPGGVMVVSNQGDDEARRQQEIFDALHIEATPMGPVAADVSPFSNVRPVWVARRGG